MNLHSTMYFLLKSSLLERRLKTLGNPALRFLEQRSDLVAHEPFRQTFSAIGETNGLCRHKKSDETFGNQFAYDQTECLTLKVPQS